MSVLIVRSAVKADAVGDVDAAIEHLFAAIEQAQPNGVRYASCKLSDGVTYLALLELDEGVDNPLPVLPEFRAFQDKLKTWTAGPPTSDQATVIGSYRFF
jgi:hypothetical protein